ncbi:MAG: MFS transporter, partial [Myxococcales bacterium]
INPSFTRLMRKDLGFDEATIGTLAGVVDPIAAVAGALIGGVLADRVGKKQIIGAFMGGIAATLAAFGLSQDLWALNTVVAYVVVINIVINAYNAATLGFFMSLSNPAIGATQFAVFMAMTNLCYSQATKWGGWVADRFGYPAMFLTAAAIQLVTIALLPFCNEQAAKRRFREGTAAEALEAKA